MELSKQSVQDKLLRARLGCIIRKFPTKRNKAKIISIIFFCYWLLRSTECKNVWYETSEYFLFTLKMSLFETPESLIYDLSYKNMASIEKGWKDVRDEGHLFIIPFISYDDWYSYHLSNVVLISFFYWLCVLNLIGVRSGVIMQNFD